MGSWAEREGRGKGRNAYAWNFALEVEDEVRADYRAARTSFLPLASRKITTTAREEREEAGAAAARESKVKLQRRRGEVSGSRQSLLRVLPDCETGNCATMLAPGGGTSPFRLRLLLPPRCIDELVVEILVCAFDEIIEREDSEDILRLDEVAGVSTSRRLLAAARAPLGTGVETRLEEKS